MKQHKLFIINLIKRTMLLLFILCSGSVTLFSQNVDALLSEGRLLRSKYQDDAALAKFEAALKLKPENVEALHNTSWLVAQIGDRKEDESTKKEYFERARKLAQKAIKLNEKNAEAHYAYVKSLGLLSEVASSTKEELKNAKIIKAEAERVIELKPNHAAAHYVLGRWHHKISDLAWYEVTAAKILFGGVPEGASFEKAIEHYKKAIKLKPTYILYYFGMAEAYVDMGEKEKAIELLEKTVKMKSITPDDPRRLQKCKDLLAKLKK